MTVQRPARDTRLDLLRGLLQLQIFASHASGSLIGGWLITAAWGLSDASEQFVFLSGFALGSVFTLKARKGGFRAACQDLAQRIGRLHRTHLMLVCGFAAFVITLDLCVPLPGEARAMGWGWMLDAPWFALPGAAALLYQPHFMGILPLFLVCMLGLPLAMYGFERRGALALAPALMLYAAVQLWGWHLPALGGSEVELNPLAWQLLFLLGAWFGRQALLRGRAIPLRRPLILLAALIVLFGIWIRAIDHGLIAGPGFDLEAMMRKQDLAWPRLVHALAVSFLAIVLFRRRDLPLRGIPAQALAAAGRHSLRIFCCGLFLSYGAATLYRLHPALRLWLELPLIGGGCALLLALAIGLDRRQPAPSPLYRRAAARLRQRAGRMRGAMPATNG